MHIDSPYRPLGAAAVPVPQGLDIRLAHWIANLFAPPVMAVAAIVLVARAEGSWQALRWAMAYVLIALPVPLAYVAWLLRRGSISDFHIPVREERMRPFVVSVACATAGLFVLDRGNAPPLFVLVAASGLVLALLLFGVTLFWKISTHTAAIASLAVLAIGLQGAGAAPVSLAVPLVAWSRVRLGRHDRAQAMAGSVLGALTTVVALHFAPR